MKKMKDVINQRMIWLMGVGWGGKKSPNLEGWRCCADCWGKGSPGGGTGRHQSPVCWRMKVWLHCGPQETATQNETGVMVLMTWNSNVFGGVLFTFFGIFRTLEPIPSRALIIFFQTNAYKRNCSHDTCLFLPGRWLGTLKIDSLGVEARRRGGLQQGGVLWSAVAWSLPHPSLSFEAKTSSFCEFLWAWLIVAFQMA